MTTLNHNKGDFMHSVEFEANIENGVVHIPKQYKALQQNIKATFVVMYDSMKRSTIQEGVEEELDMLFSQSDNQIKVTMVNAVQTDGMMGDGIL